MPPGLDEIAKWLAPEHLEVFGAFHPAPDDRVPEDTKTLLLLGPAEPGFWTHVTTSPEFADGGPDPLDRWSARAITDIAEALGATPLFPFGRPPYLPFFTWALKSGRAWQSPVALLVHDRAGLMVSYRGALALPWRLDLPETPPCPCDTCATRPCLTACPVVALTSAGYDLNSCHAFLDTPVGDDCLTDGCRVRRLCPVSQSYGRLPDQSGFHMRAFHP
ncbi:ferredoxin [Pseudoruegeria sp. HB172150]|uniref:ferredoxin n=1 Tax=Pseudoruegeria sp. HB172150 TaxID=2721164 RepID=UPI001553D542|nr:ferredoxin [Pseudoruegeria sp. HB172150]